MFESLKGNQKLILLIISLGAFMGFLDVSIVNVSLPTMARFFGVSTSSIFWVILIYVIVLGSFLIAFGKLAQQKGYKKVFLTGFFLFVIGSAVSGLAHHFDTLIMARFIQAVGAAMFSAITAAMVAIYLPENVRGRNMGIIATMGSLGMALGPVLGGLLTQYINFHWIFYINVPIGIIAILLGKAVFNETDTQSGKLDVPGIILIFIAQTTLIFALNRGLTYGWTSSIILGTITISIVFWILFLLHESRTTEPLLDLNFVRIRKIVLATTGNFFFNMPYSAAVVLLPFYFELVKGFSVSRSGMALAIMPVAIMIVGPLAGALSDKINPNRVALMGSVAGIAGCILIALFNPSSSILFIVISLLVMGASVAAFNPPNTKFIIGESPNEYRGIASGLVNTARMMGNGFGVAILTTVAAMAIFQGMIPSTASSVSPVLVSAGIHNAFIIGAIIMVIAMILIALTREKHEIKEDYLQSQDSKYKELVE